MLSINAVCVEWQQDGSFSLVWAECKLSVVLGENSSYIKWPHEGSDFGGDRGKSADEVQIFLKERDLTNLSFYL